MNADQADKRKEYFDERTLLVNAEQESSKSFDKAMLTLSAGALGLSLTYMRDFARHPCCSALLYIAWAMFGLCLLSTAWSFLLSQSGLRRQRQINELDCFSVGPNTPNPKSRRNRYANATNCLNWLSAIAFSFGLIVLTLFAIANFPTRDAIDMSKHPKVVRGVPGDEDYVKHGFVAPTPPKPPGSVSENETPTPDSATKEPTTAPKKEKTDQP
jgi:hypothetical protein